MPVLLDSQIIRPIAGARNLARERWGESGSRCRGGCTWGVSSLLVEDGMEALMRVGLAAAVCTMLAACSNGDGGDEPPDAARSREVGPAETSPSEAPCNPDCQGRDCGSDGCGGTCGDCELSKTCSDAGKCESAECISSKDCPGDLVCNEDLSTCVVCVSSDDCPEGFECGPDWDCHEVFKCASDKDCKAHGLVCDKGAGKCVQCLVEVDCADDRFCQDRYCLPDVCAAGERDCEGLQVRQCRGDGGGWEPAELCTELQYCEEGGCHDRTCNPAEVYCVGTVLLECDSIGKEGIEQEDCAKGGKVCFEAACVTPLCKPSSSYCKDSTTVAHCVESGMSENLVACPEKQFCEAGACHPWVCPAGQEFCEGDVHKVCDASGGKVIFEEDCAADDKVCIDGKCQALACTPLQSFCLTDFIAAKCSEVGLDYESLPCDPGNYCKLGQCQAQVCEPSSSYCAGPVAFKCDALGSAIVSQVNCADSQLLCQDGECVPCVPACGGKECGPDGCFGSCGSCDDGNDCTTDQCNKGVCSHTPVTDGAVCKKTGVCKGVCADGLCFEMAVEDCLTPEDDDCDGKTNEANAKNCSIVYTDEDGDGYAGTPVCLCQPPPGGSKTLDDCCDTDPKAFPGQKLFFDKPREGCPGFDYNCDKNEEAEKTSSCVATPCATSGWFQPAPACGQEGNFCPNCPSCGVCVGFTEKMVQKCR